MWFKVDDKLHDHRKSRKAGKAAMGVWVLAGSWSMDNETDGFIPLEVLSRWGTIADARRLTDAGLWREGSHKGEQGWRFHDWSRFQPSAAVTAARRAAEAEAGIRGNHKRWHVDRKITDPDCEYCHRVPDGEPDADPIGGGESAPIPPVPVPDPHTSPNGDVDAASTQLAIPRADVERVCNALASFIEDGGSKRPTVTETWRKEARLLIDKDGRSEEQVHGCIRWLFTSDHRDAIFWRVNIRSFPKLRAEYDRLRELSTRPTATSSRNQAQTDLLTRAMARAEAKEAAMRGEGA